MQYVWQHRLWPRTHMCTVDGRPVQIIDPGRLNTNAGPDFFNAKIVIDGHTWAGDVEIHVRASDWHRHGHDSDPAYNSVILHVVDRDDAPIYRSNGEIIPQMRMACTPDFHQKYSRLVDRADRDLPCASQLQSIPSIYISDWLESLAFERLYSKAERIESLSERFGGDWESAAYVTLARCLGFGVNGDPFERLALSTPLMFIGKHCDSLFTIEALLFGQSGLLDDAPAYDEYVSGLRKEYAFICHKFGLKKPESLGWKMSKMRPGNFPHRRIATLACLLHGGIRLISKLLSIDSIEQANDMFSLQLTGYWTKHYSFGTATPNAATSLSRQSVIGLMINAVVPIQFAYAMARGNRQMSDNAIELLQSLPAENNSIVNAFQQGGIKIRSAFASQAIIQLRRCYCECRKCLYCRIGHRMLSASCPRN